jgi:5'-phosphate synthase pdxT subunit
LTRATACARASLINGEPFRAVFIRAPAIVSHGAAVEVLAEYHVPEGRVVAETQCSKVAVAVRQGQLLGTAFHPELTADTRWHRLFVNMCEQAPAPAAPAALEATGSAAADCLPLVPPPPLPVF